MKIKPIHLLLILCLSGFSLVVAGGGDAGMETLLRDAVSDDKEISTPALHALREQGPDGMRSFMDAHKDMLEGTEDENLRYRAALDVIAGQKDSYFSGLFWYTDLEKAKAQSMTEDKAILSLRMLGNLDEDLSCANSRLFRVLLYANKEVSSFLQDNFILHWSSERPVPVVSIDFGDGRVMKRTLTGNSIHYVMDAKGRPIDAIPGLNSPSEFIRSLGEASDLYKEVKDEDEARFAKKVATAHRKQFKKVAEVAEDHNIALEGLPVVENPDAVEAEMITVAKSNGETPLLEEMEMDDPRGSLDPWKDEILVKKEENRERWFAVALDLGIDARLDANTYTLMKTKNPAKYSEEMALMKEGQGIEERLLIETARNEVILRSELHRWFIEAELTKDFNTLNSEVYSRLFLTPRSDEWLGLLPEDAFMALDNDGIVE